jgi:hypothetical protein
MPVTRMFRAAAAGLVTLVLSLTAAVAAQAAPAARPLQAVRSHEPVATGLARLATYKYTLSRIAWSGSHILIAAVDSHGDLYFFWQKAGTTTWHKQLVAAGGKKAAYHSPSITWTGNAVAIAAVDKAGDLVYFRQASGSSKWRDHRVARASSGRFSSPSITALSGAGVLISADTPTALVSYEQASGRSTWTRLVVATGQFGAPSIIICYDSHVAENLALVTAASSTHSLYFWWEVVRTPGWHQETVAAAGSSGGYVGGSLAATTENLLLTAATTTGDVDEWSQAIGGTGWSESSVANGIPGAPYVHPQIAWTGPVPDSTVTFDVITGTQDGSLVFWWAANGSGTWAGEVVAGVSPKAVAYSAPGISVTGKSVVLTAVNTTSGEVDFWHQKYGTTTWPKQRVAKG